MAGIARDVVVRPTIADRQLASASAAADETSEQCIAVLGRPLMPTRRDVLAHHPADRLRTLPIDVSFVRPGLQRQPFSAWLTAALGTDGGTAVLHHHSGSTIGIGAAV